MTTTIPRCAALPRVISPACPRLAPELVQLWTASLAQPAGVVADLHATLSPEERERADRYHFDRHRTHFVVARGLLRAILGSYLDAEPDTIAIASGPFGKPMLTGRSQAAVTFNVAHTDDRAVFAVALERAVGVDIERVGARDTERLARRICSPREIASLAGAADPSADVLAYWTCKEAYLKARGTGLSLEPWLVQVQLDRDGHAAIVAVAGDAAEAARWRLERVPASPLDLIAVVARGRDWTLEHPWENAA